MENRISRIISLGKFLESEATTSEKVAEVKLCIALGIITVDEGIDLIVEYTNLYRQSN